MELPKASRPGLAKTRGQRLVRVHAPPWVVGSPGEFKRMFDRADAVSEGALREEGEQAFWYGTTSLVLAWPKNLDRAGFAYVAAVAARDPHVRIWAIRIAHREASVRAPAPLGRVSCEVRVEARDDGLRIDVDVQAPLTLLSHRGLLGRRPPV